MATKKDIDSMTLDEVEDYKLGIKNKIRALQEDYRAANKVRKIRVLEWHKEEAVKQLNRASQASGLSLEEQAQRWMTEGDLGQQRQARLILTGTTKES